MNFCYIFNSCVRNKYLSYIDIYKNFKAFNAFHAY